MPYSTFAVQAFKDEINRKLDGVEFKTPEDFDRFCTSAISLVDSSVKIELNIEYKNTIEDVKKLLDGFDVYPSVGILDATYNRVTQHSVTSVLAGLSESELMEDAKSPVFVSQRELAYRDSKSEVKVSREEKIKEAREAFQAIIRGEIKKRIEKLANMSQEERENYIKDYQLKQALGEHKAPEPDSEAHVLSGLDREQARFNAESSAQLQAGTSYRGILNRIGGRAEEKKQTEEMPNLGPTDILREMPRRFSLRQYQRQLVVWLTMQMAMQLELSRGSRLSIPMLMQMREQIAEEMQQEDRQVVRDFFSAGQSRVARPANEEPAQPIREDEGNQATIGRRME